MDDECRGYLTQMERRTFPESNFLEKKIVINPLCTVIYSSFSRPVIMTIQHQCVALITDFTLMQIVAHVFDMYMT